MAVITAPTPLPEACRLALDADRRELVDAAISAGVFRPYGIERLSMSTDALEREQRRLEPLAAAAVAALHEGLQIILADPDLELVGLNAAAESAWSAAPRGRPIGRELLARVRDVDWITGELVVAGADGGPVRYLDVVVRRLPRRSRKAQRPPQRRGPPPLPVWEAIKPDVTAWLEKDRRPAGSVGKQAELERFIGDLLERHGVTHATSTIRAHARGFLAAHLDRIRKGR